LSLSLRVTARTLTHADTQDKHRAEGRYG
jgi:hypothetical protein